MNKNLKPSRYPSRVSHDYEELYNVLDDALFCTIAYVEEGKPFQIPTGFCRLNNEIFIHGSSKSHFIEYLLQSKHVSISIMLTDALVLAPTAFDHSVNYRSAIIYSKANLVADVHKKKQILGIFTDKMIPGRMSDLPEITERELEKTSLLSFQLSEFSVKKRVGQTGMDVSKGKVWSGIVPMSVAYSIPEADPSLQEKVNIPDYLTKMVIKSNAK